MRNILEQHVQNRWWIFSKGDWTAMKANYTSKQNVETSSLMSSFIHTLTHNKHTQKVLTRRLTDFFSSAIWITFKRTSMLTHHTQTHYRKNKHLKWDLISRLYLLESRYMHFVEVSPHSFASVFISLMLRETSETKTFKWNITERFIKSVKDQTLSHTLFLWVHANSHL